MSDRIEGIQRIARVEPVRGYTLAERVAKLRQIEREAADRAEIREYLAKYPNPDHLSFADLLEQAIKGQKITEEELDYILDIGNHKYDDGVIIEIKGDKK